MYIITRALVSRIRSVDCDSWGYFLNDDIFFLEIQKRRCTILLFSKCTSNLCLFVLHFQTQTTTISFANLQTGSISTCLFKDCGKRWLEWLWSSPSLCMIYIYMCMMMMMDRVIIFSAYDTAYLQSIAWFLFFFETEKCFSVLVSYLSFWHVAQIDWTIIPCYQFSVTNLNGCIKTFLAEIVGWFRGFYKNWNPKFWS
jgi:hypothetical protein